MSEAHTILFVDDEPNVLDGIRRQLRGKFKAQFAVGPQAGLEALRAATSFSVIISDMNMPGMDGATFLAESDKICPESVKVMLTGNADQETAARAVNQGRIFRFLNKPCEPDKLTNALNDALTQFALIRSQKELLENTLGGSVKLMTDIVSLTDPKGFGDTLALRDLLRRFAAEAHYPSTWDLELAVLVMNVGQITVPAPTMLKFRRGLPLTSDENRVIEELPLVGSRLLNNIPRLADAAEIILYGDKHYDGTGFPRNDVAGEGIPIGARMLHIAKNYLKLRREGKETASALRKLVASVGQYDPNLLGIFISKVGQLDADEIESKGFEITWKQLFIGQRLLSDVVAKNGTLLIAAGSIISETMLQRLPNHAALVGIRHPILVDSLIPHVHSALQREAQEQQ